LILKRFTVDWYFSHSCIRPFIIQQAAEDIAVYTIFPVGFEEARNTHHAIPPKTAQTVFRPFLIEDRYVAKIRVTICTEKGRRLALKLLSAPL
jgi:hypothetical protein